MEAGLLVLLGATVARGLLASTFALVNERLCSSRASTSGSSRCRTDDLLHAPRGPARRGIEARPRGPFRLLARGVDAALGAAARCGASPGPADGPQSPSSVCTRPPRTRNLPPYFSTVPGTCFRYSSNPVGSVTSLSTMKYAGMRRSPRKAPLSRKTAAHDRPV